VSRHDYNRINKRMRKGMCLQKFVSICKNEFINKNKQENSQLKMSYLNRFQLKLYDSKEQQIQQHWCRNIKVGYIVK